MLTVLVDDSAFAKLGTSATTMSGLRGEHGCSESNADRIDARAATDPNQAARADARSVAAQTLRGCRDRRGGFVPGVDVATVARQHRGEPA
jgi:hypothetical protein